MTCIVALRNGDKVYMGADSATVDGNGIIMTNEVSKIEKIGNKFLLGFAGSVSNQTNAMRFIVSQKINFAEITFENFASTLVDYYLYNKYQDGMLLADINNISFITSNGYTKFNKYYSLGSGYQVALGALIVTECMDNPLDRLNLVLKATAIGCSSVRAPFLIESL